MRKGEHFASAFPLVIACLGKVLKTEISCRFEGAISFLAAVKSAMAGGEERQGGKQKKNPTLKALLVVFLCFNTFL